MWIAIYFNDSNTINIFQWCKVNFRDRISAVNTDAIFLSFLTGSTDGVVIPVDGRQVSRPTTNDRYSRRRLMTYIQVT